MSIFPPPTKRPLKTAPPPPESVLSEAEIFDNKGIDAANVIANEAIRMGCRLPMITMWWQSRSAPPPEHASKNPMVKQPELTTDRWHRWNSKPQMVLSRVNPTVSRIISRGCFRTQLGYLIAWLRTNGRILPRQIYHGLMDHFNATPVEAYQHMFFSPVHFADYHTTANASASGMTPERIAAWYLDMTSGGPIIKADILGFAVPQRKKWYVMALMRRGSRLVPFMVANPFKLDARIAYRELFEYFKRITGQRRVNPSNVALSAADAVEASADTSKSSASKDSFQSNGRQMYFQYCNFKICLGDLDPLYTVPGLVENTSRTWMRCEVTLAAPESASAASSAAASVDASASGASSAASSVPSADATSSVNAPSASGPSSRASSPLSFSLAEDDVDIHFRTDSEDVDSTLSFEEIDMPRDGYDSEADPFNVECDD